MVVRWLSASYQIVIEGASWSEDRGSQCMDAVIIAARP